VTRRIDAFVVSAPGLEQLVLSEARRLGVRPARAVTGGVECNVTWAQLWALNLRSRLASRVLVRVAQFHADGFHSLQTGVRAVDWSAWLAGGGVTVSASCDKGSKLYHSGAVAERVGEAIGFGEGSQQVLVRVARNVVTISIDSSGAPLHQRGWRGPSGKAPIRETLASALIAAGGWDARSPLADPFCGSGTVAVEAALTARRVAPGLRRSFAFEAWPSFDEAAWQRQRDAALANILDRCPPIAASDRDAGAVAAAQANAEAAGVAAFVDVHQRSVSDLQLPARPGHVVTNPPYGKRAGGGDVRNLYAAFGAVLRERAAGWRLTIIAPSAAPWGQLGVVLSDELRTANGGLPVVIRTAQVAAPAP
jgi:putative N6-adenine-specific DNA methylase